MPQHHPSDATCVFCAGPIPTEIGHLSQLQELYLCDTDLAGSTFRCRCDTAAALVCTYTIHLFAVGRIPTEIGLLTELTTLDLGESELSGVLS